jgi:hypothetical protein
MATKKKTEKVEPVKEKTVSQVLVFHKHDKETYKICKSVKEAFEWALEDQGDDASFSPEVENYYSFFIIEDGKLFEIGNLEVEMQVVNISYEKITD